MKSKTTFETRTTTRDGFTPKFGISEQVAPTLPQKTATNHTMALWEKPAWWYGTCFM